MSWYEITEDGVPYLVDNLDPEQRTVKQIKDKGKTSLISRVAFFKRFTANEQETIVTHSHAKAKTFLYELRLRDQIDLQSPTVAGHLNSMEIAGVIDAGRAAEILAL